MLKIALCCKSNYGKLLKEYLLCYSYQKDIEFEVSAVSKCGELCNNSIELFYDLIFLDIDGAEEEIQEVGICLRNKKYNGDTAIVFVSENKKCPAEYIKLQPKDYLIHPIGYGDLSECMDNYIKSKFQGNGLFRYKKNRTVCTINVSKILYLQSNGKKVVIYAQKEKFDFYGKLSECMKEECFKSFIEIHQSFFINSQYIEQIEREHVILAGNIRLPISRSKAENIRKWSLKNQKAANFSI